MLAKELIKSGKRKKWVGSFVVLIAWSAIFLSIIKSILILIDDARPLLASINFAGRMERLAYDVGLYQNDIALFVSTVLKYFWLFLDYVVRTVWGILPALQNEAYRLDEMITFILFFLLMITSIRIGLKIREDGEDLLTQVREAMKDLQKEIMKQQASGVTQGKGDVTVSNASIVNIDISTVHVPLVDETRWYERPGGLVTIGLFITVLGTFIATYFVRLGDIVCHYLDVSYVC